MAKTSKSRKPVVAYFCMEYALTSDMKTYSGGLGVLAGDYLKGAADLDLPIVGIGLKWKQGYTRQTLDEQGRLIDSYLDYPYPNLKDTGKTVVVQIRKRPVRLKIWAVTGLGVKKLYLLDADHPDNADRFITGQLYGWFGEERVAQEIILGVGGVLALEALGYQPDLYHFNEGHAVLAALELLRRELAQGHHFDEARQRIRDRCVFTTHTPVKAGNESHAHELLQYMGASGGLSVEQMHVIGGTPFNMTVAALRLSRRTNAVAQLHAETAEAMWSDIRDRRPILGITNGIHRGTWVDARIAGLVDDPGGLWQRHQELKEALIGQVRERTGVALKKDRLLIGFARRATPYKRSNLIFQTGKRVLKLLESGKVQIVFSGKTHPQDFGGRDVLHDILAHVHEYPDSVVFLQDYDMTLGALLTRGSDVWLNNPRRPMEACGTSGMKAAMNGVLNLSILDGWWPEACEHGVNGWAIGDETVPEDEAKQDTRDAKALARTLLEEVVPTYYDHPERWVAMMQASMRSVTKPFQVETMLKNYYRHLYRR